MNASILLLHPANFVAALLLALSFAINVGVRRPAMNWRAMAIAALFCNGLAISLVVAFNWLSVS
ncbi:hypothetical protein FAZ95_26765 [Trinickia violacea]|uniref:Uncharacterized protein n=1 Tax=Trinickia violacea TaxID=2571746 RepID=A0A4P8IXQ7_9BURK|nr:hypothetical protein [Trinickia violacea]QCP52745.1 hypothetical protein FAZ95_26765 [Trinickia violacea]